MIKDRVLDILVVEDEMNSALLTDKIKAEFKENVRIHKNGHGILHDLNQHKDLDLIIVDEQYTKENIVDTVKTIRRKSPYTEVIVLSSERESTIMNKVKEAGAYDFIYKDRSAVDKVIYVIKAFWSNKKLHVENIHLKQTRKKSKGTMAVLVFVVLAIIAFSIYYFTR